MTRVRVVTDSTASLDPEIVKDLDITIMPMQIHVGGEIWEETKIDALRDALRDPPIHLFNQ